MMGEIFGNSLYYCRARGPGGPLIITNEDGLLTEYDETILDNGGIIEQSPSSARVGTLGLNARAMTVNESSGAGVSKNVRPTIESVTPGSSLWVGYWFRFHQNDFFGAYLLHLGGVGQLNLISIGWPEWYPRPTTWIQYETNGGENHTEQFGGFPNEGDCDYETWYWVVLQFTRATTPGASDGAVRFFLGDELRREVLGIANWDRFSAANDDAQIYCGLSGYRYTDPPGVDFDEIILTTEGHPAPL